MGFPGLGKGGGENKKHRAHQINGGPGGGEGNFAMDIIKILNLFPFFFPPSRRVLRGMWAFSKAMPSLRNMLRCLLWRYTVLPKTICAATCGSSPTSAYTQAYGFIQMDWYACIYICSANWRRIDCIRCACRTQAFAFFKIVQKKEKVAAWHCGLATPWGHGGYILSWGLIV